MSLVDQQSLLLHQLRQLVQQATPEQRHWLTAYLEHVRRHPDVQAAREAGGDVVGFLFEKLRTPTAISPTTSSRRWC